jgi:hypothetical protein
MKLEKFINKLDNDEIKDLKPYIEKENVDILLEIARRGLEVDYLLKRGELEVICVLIRYGHASEYYPLWRHHSDKMVRQAMAGKGLFRDEFIKDRKYEVRLAAAGYDPEYLIKLSNRTKTIIECKQIVNRFCEISNLTIEHIDFISQQHFLSEYKKQAFQLKRDALTKEPTVFEKTLSVTQLFELDNPLWTIDLTANVISQILSYYNDAKQDNWTKHFSGLLDLIVANNYQNLLSIFLDYRSKIKN